MYLGGGWGPFYSRDESRKNTNPLVLWKGPAGFVELAICGDGGCESNANVPWTLVLKESSDLSCRISRKAINS